MKRRPERMRPGLNGVYLFTSMLLLITFLLHNDKVQGAIVHRAKKTLKLFQSPSSLIQLRHKRETFANEQSQSTLEEAGNYYDSNYDVLPDVFTSYPPPTLEDHISAKAKQIAESFANMWQSLTDSIRHCFDGFRAVFGDAGELEAEQKEQNLENIAEGEEEEEDSYRLKLEQENEVLMSTF